MTTSQPAFVPPISELSLGPSSDEIFIVTYDGPRVAGQMDAHTLGAAMISLSQLVSASAALTFGAGTPVHTDISADFRRGSFSFAAVALGPVAAEAKRLLSTMTMKELLEIIGITGGGGLIAFLAWLRGRKIASVIPNPATTANVDATEEATATVVTADGASTVVHAHTVVLFQNSNVRQNLAGLLAPLQQEGITEFRSGRPGQKAAVITSEQVEYFDAPAPIGEQLQDKVSTEIVQLTGISFTPGHKWRFRMADGTSFTSTLDDKFTKAVAQHEVVFGAGDALEVELRNVVTRDSFGELHATRSIEGVVRHIPATKSQLPLGLVDEDSGVSPYRE
jgi:hypothetical protein